MSNLSGHFDLSHQYGCKASMTVVTFILAGMIFRARRLFRADVATTGKIELYTICPYNTSTHQTWEGYLNSTTGEDWLRYVDESNPDAVDEVAMLAIAAVSGSEYRPNSLSLEQSLRSRAIELN